MPDIEVTKDNFYTTVALLNQNMESLVSGLEEFKNQDKAWKEEYKLHLQQENERLKILEEFMIRKTTENGFHKEQTLQDQERIKSCNERFQRYDRISLWVESMEKFFWILVTVVVGSAVTSIFSLIKQISMCNR